MRCSYFTCYKILSTIQIQIQNTKYKYKIQIYKIQNIQICKHYNWDNMDIMTVLKDMIDVRNGFKTCAYYTNNDVEDVINDICLN